MLVLHSASLSLGLFWFYVGRVCLSMYCTGFGWLLLLRLLLVPLVYFVVLLLTDLVLALHLVKLNLDLCFLVDRASLSMHFSCLSWLFQPCLSLVSLAYFVAQVMTDFVWAQRSANLSLDLCLVVGQVSFVLLVHYLAFALVL